MRVALALAVTMLGALGVAYAAVTGSPPAWLAGALAVAFLGLAAAASIAAVELHAPDDLAEPRAALGPTVADPLPPDVTRPAFGRMWFAALGTLAALGLIPLISLARKPGRSDRTGWASGVRLVDVDNQAIAQDRLDSGGITTVFPEGGIAIADAPAVLIRLDDRYVAFSKICTHAGCPVALYRHASRQLYCPCHQSRFDVTDGAKPVAGPAPRALPQLPLGTDAQGYLIALGSFSAPVGPDDWDRVS
jgi:ubiquinol-cytochrome c reductase iron-sulfur subunit